MAGLRRPGTILAPVAALAVALLALPGAGQTLPPVTDPVLRAADEAAGTVVPPALNITYAALGQNLTREDVRMGLDLNVTKGDFGLLGLVVGSAKAEVGATLHARLEIGVLSADRIRALLASAGVEGAENMTFLTGAYVPADVFRATLAAEVVAAFQGAQEEALQAYLAETLPELQVLDVKFQWSGTGPQDALTDVDLATPPIVLDVTVVAQWIYVTSVPSLVRSYVADQADTSDESREAYVKRLKAESGDPLRTRDFFAAAAYTQMLNLSLPEGWGMDVALTVPEGFSFTYTNRAVERDGPRRISFHVGDEGAGTEPSAAAQEVFLASLTNRRAVALALFAGLWVVGVAVALPGRLAHAFLRRRRIVDALDAPPLPGGAVATKDGWVESR